MSEIQIFNFRGKSFIWPLQTALTRLLNAETKQEGIAAAQSFKYSLRNIIENCRKSTDDYDETEYGRSYQLLQSIFYWVPHYLNPKKNNRSADIKAMINAQGEAILLDILKEYSGSIFSLHISPDRDKRKIIFWIDPDGGFTPLMSLIKERYNKVIPEFMMELIKASKEAENESILFTYLSHLNHNHSSALTIACYINDTGIASSILDCLGSIKERKKEDIVHFIMQSKLARSFPVLTACTNGNVDLLNKLLLGISRNDTTDDKLITIQQHIIRSTPTGWTPLHAATYHGHVEAVRLLLAIAKGSKNTVVKTNEFFQDFITKTDQHGFSALNRAAARGYVEIVKLLLESAKESYGGENTEGFMQFLTHTGTRGDSALTLALKNEHLEVTEVLLHALRQAFGVVSKGEKTESNQKFRAHLKVGNAWHDSAFSLAAKLAQKNQLLGKRKREEDERKPAIHPVKIQRSLTSSLEQTPQNGHQFRLFSASPILGGTIVKMEKISSSRTIR